MAEVDLCLSSCGQKRFMRHYCINSFPLLFGQSPIREPNEVRVSAIPVLQRKARYIAALLIAAVLVMTASIESARAQKVALVRDAEIEGLLKDYTGPIFKAAGLGKGAVDVYLINNNSFNAFVTGRNMFIHTGALMRSQTPNEIIGVIAHETGHVIGGHLVRMRDRMEQAQIIAGVGILLGAGAMATGGELGSAAGQAILRGGQDSLMRSLLAYKRDEESSADRAALTLLEKTGQSGRGMIQTFKTMMDGQLFSSSRLDPYIQSHPLPRDRIALLQTAVEQSPNFNKKDPPALQLRHDMMRAKIAAYSGGFGALRQMFKDDPKGAPARYGVAISQFLQGKTGESLKIIDKLIAEQPKNAYLHEMKAEILLRGRKPDEALKPMQAAIRLDPYDSGLLRIQYGHVLMETGNPANITEAVRQIKRGLASDPRTISGYEYLARAHSLLGEESLALAATAEGRFLVGDYKEAKRFAIRAQQNLKKNSPQWVRLQDIILYKPKKTR